jgi:hypothetical protein
MSNSLELLQEAAIVLAQHGSVKDRLAEAWLRHLSLLDAALLPEMHRAEFRAMAEAMRRERPLPRENPARASVRKMSAEEAGRYATLVVRIYGAVARGGSPVSVVRPLPLSPIVQLFAADA